MSVEVRILGLVEVVKDGRVVPLARAKARAFLAFLALEAGREASRDRMIEALWGEQELRDARNSLQAQVAQLRRALKTAGEPDLLLTRPGGYALALDPASIDLARFERLSRAGRDALAAGDAATASRFLTEALTLWRGEPLGGLGDEPFVRPAAARLEQLRLAAVEDRVEADLRLGRHDEIVAELSALVADEPYHERLRGQLALALYRCGRQADALETLRAQRRLLNEELGLEPGPGLRRLERAILEQDEALARPGPAETPSPASGLPAPTTMLVGREAELSLLRSLLEAPERRVVTLTGPGGTGKTRLAIALAHEAAPMFRDGAAFVDLATVSQPERLPAAVAEQLGMTDEPRRSPFELLCDRLRARHQLIVLDNFEQVVDAAPRVGELCNICPDVRFVVTSREALRLGVEREVPVAPLALPVADDPDAVERSPAGALMLERARAVRPGFELRNEDAAALAQVCRRVDGLPLALELAAARLHILSARELSERVGRSLEVLTGGARDAAPRHRTLRATLGWSYELLDQDEQRAFAALGVFAADFSLEAAEAICMPSRRNALDLVASLVEKSLVQRVETGASRSRLRLLETVREFARERLAASHTEEEIRLRHAGYFAGFADKAALAFDGPDRVLWFDRLDLERENLRAALEAHLSSGRTDKALRMIAALWEWWFVRGHWLEGEQWTDRALAVAADASGPARAAALNAAGIFAFLGCEFARARGLLEDALVANRELGDIDGEATALRALAGVEREAGHYERSLAYQAEGLKLWRALGDARNVAGSLNGLTMTRLLEAAIDDARALATESLEVAERQGARMESAAALGHLALVHHLEGDAKAAADFTRRSVTMARELRYTEGIAWGHYVFALVALRAGEYQASCAAGQEALECYRALGDRVSIARTLETLAGAAAGADTHERSALLLGAADSIRTAIGAPVSPLEAPARDDTLATLREALGDPLAEFLERGQRLTSSEVDILASAPIEDTPRPDAERLLKTFMFTDIVSSTSLIGAIGDEAWVDLRRWHDETLRAIFAGHAGEEIDHAGDGFFVAFGDATAAVECAVAIQRALADHRREHGFAPQVRIGLHACEATRVGDDYQGRGVHVAARIGAEAAGGEILISSETVTATASRFSVGNLRSVSLKGIAEPIELGRIDSK